MKYEGGVGGQIDPPPQEKLPSKSPALLRLIDNAEDLDIVMPVYNLLEYKENYSITSRSLWNCYRNEVNNSANENNDANNYRINSNKTITSKSFKYKKKILGRTPDDNNILGA